MMGQLGLVKVNRLDEFMDEQRKLREQSKVEAKFHIVSLTEVGIDARQTIASLFSERIEVPGLIGTSPRPANGARHGGVTGRRRAQARAWSTKSSTR